MRHLLLAMLSMALLACNSVPGMIGQGPKTISENLAATISDYDKDLRFRNISIAIAKDSRNVSMTYCPALGDCVNDLDGSVVDRCNKGGKHECELFMLDDKVVWKGPVQVRHRATAQELPYSGRWRVRHEWTGIGTGETDLFAHFGQIHTGPIDGAGECVVRLSPTLSKKGTFRMKCSNDIRAHGSYLISGQKHLVATGTDSENRSLKIEIDLNAGQAEKA